MLKALDGTARDPYPGVGGRGPGGRHRGHQGRGRGEPQGRAARGVL